MIVDLTRSPVARLLDSRYPAPTQRDPAPSYAHELVFCEAGSMQFGVRYTDGTEKLVEDTPRNREVYKAMIDWYREQFDAKYGWID